MSPDHPERVAAWLSEVFGGPKFYSERYGGYSRMISQHVGKNISEEQRARWVKMLCQSADDAKLPDDAEFRAAFVAYLEWGSGSAKKTRNRIRRLHRTCLFLSGGGSAMPSRARASRR